jgi:hypothetical protein
MSNTSHFLTQNNQVIHQQSEIQQTQSHLHHLEVESGLECS